MKILKRKIENKKQSSICKCCPNQEAKTLYIMIEKTKASFDFQLELYEPILKAGVFSRRQPQHEPSRDPPLVTYAHTTKRWRKICKKIRVGQQAVSHYLA